MRHIFSVIISGNIYIKKSNISHWGSTLQSLVSPPPSISDPSTRSHFTLSVWKPERTVKLCPTAPPAPPAAAAAALCQSLPSWCVLVSDWNRHVHPAGQKHHLHQELHVLSVRKRCGKPDETDKHDCGRQQDLRQPQWGVLQVSAALEFIHRHVQFGVQVQFSVFWKMKSVLVHMFGFLRPSKVSDLVTLGRPIFNLVLNLSSWFWKGFTEPRFSDLLSRPWTRFPPSRRWSPNLWNWQKMTQTSFTSLSSGDVV